MVSHWSLRPNHETQRNWGVPFIARFESTERPKLLSFVDPTIFVIENLITHWPLYQTTDSGIGMTSLNYTATKPDSQGAMLC